MYFGSVRFFRHLLIAILLLFLFLPLILAGVFSVKYAQTCSRMENVIAVMNECSEKQDKLKTEFEQLSNTVRNQIMLLQPQINVAINDQMSEFQEQLGGIISDQEKMQQDLQALIRGYR